MKKLLSTFLMFVLLVSGCTITQEFNFNNDFSGEMKNEIDFSILTALMGMDSTGTNSLDTLEIVYRETLNKLMNVRGISNQELNWTNDSSKLILSYNFKDIEALNRALAASEILGEGKEKNGSFKLKRKKLTYTTPVFDLDSLKNNENMKTSGDFFNFNLHFTFKDEIKKLSGNKDIDISEDRKNIEASYNLNQLINKEIIREIEFKLK